MDWQNSTCILLINLKDIDGDPYGLTAESVLEKMLSKISFTFWKITNHTE